MNNKIAIVLNGTSSSGKSSIAKCIQAQLKQISIHAEIDKFLSILNFRRHPDVNERLRAVQTALDLFNHSLSEMSSKNYLIIVDTAFQEDSWYQKTMHALQNRNILFVGVHCPIEQLEARERLRENRPAGLAQKQFNLVHKNKK